MGEIEIEVKVLKIQVYRAKRNITILNKRNYRRCTILKNTFQLKVKFLTEKIITNYFDQYINSTKA